MRKSSITTKNNKNQSRKDTDKLIKRKITNQNYIKIYPKENYRDKNKILNIHWWVFISLKRKYVSKTHQESNNI